ncbi:MAG: hypothetical protein ACK557_05415, partial [Planctomycetota bacterium]
REEIVEQLSAAARQRKEFFGRDGTEFGSGTVLDVRSPIFHLYEYIDFEKRFPAGHFAFQQHDPGSRVTIRKVEVLPLEE